MDSYGEQFNREMHFHDNKQNENVSVNKQLVLSEQANEVACFCLLLCGKQAIPFSYLINIWFGDPVSFRDNLRFLIVNHFFIVNQEGIMPAEGVDKLLIPQSYTLSQHKFVQILTRLKRYICLHPKDDYALARDYYIMLRNLLNYYVRQIVIVDFSSALFQEFFTDCALWLARNFELARRPEDLPETCDDIDNHFMVRILTFAKNFKNISEGYLIAVKAELAMFYQYVFNYQVAEPILKESLNNIKNANLENTEMMARVWFIVAVMYENKTEPLKALYALVMAYRTNELVFGKDCEENIEISVRMAVILIHSGLYEEAERWYRKAVELIGEEPLPACNPVAVRLNLLKALRKRHTEVVIPLIERTVSQAVCLYGQWSVLRGGLEAEKAVVLMGITPADEKIPYEIYIKCNQMNFGPTVADRVTLHFWMMNAAANIESYVDFMVLYSEIFQWFNEEDESFNPSVRMAAIIARVSYFFTLHDYGQCVLETRKLLQFVEQCEACDPQMIETIKPFVLDVDTCKEMLLFPHYKMWAYLYEIIIKSINDDNKQAIEVCDQAITELSRCKEVCLPLKIKKAFLLFNQGQMGKAKSYLQQLVDNEKGEGSTFHLLVQIASDAVWEGEYTMALEFLNKAMIPDLMSKANYNDLAEAYFFQGCAQTYMGYHQLAEQSFLAAVDIYDLYPFFSRKKVLTYKKWADVLMEVEKYIPAQEKYNIALRLWKPNEGIYDEFFAHTCLNRAVCLAQIGRFDQAVFLLNKAVPFLSDPYGENSFLYYYYGAKYAAMSKQWKYLRKQFIQMAEEVGDTPQYQDLLNEIRGLA